MKKYLLVLTGLFFAFGQVLCAADEARPLILTDFRGGGERFCIIVPAYNEESRIGPVLREYLNYFGDRVDLLVVLNGCTDNTRQVVEVVQGLYGQNKLRYMLLEQAGKGYAVAQGFLQALRHGYDYIGFVDADGATRPREFDVLINNLSHPLIDGVIASRYMPESESTERPFIKEWGRRLCFLPIIRCLFDLDYHDTQCGAKMFTRRAIEAVAPQMRASGWNFDVELLFLARREGFNVIEVPTVWQDQEGSHLDTCGSGVPMLCSLCSVRARFCCH